MAENSLATISQQGCELIGFLPEHERGMFIRETNLSTATVVLLYPNDLFGINVDVLFIGVGYLNQKAHMILPVLKVPIPGAFSKGRCR